VRRPEQGERERERAAERAAGPEGGCKVLEDLRALRAAVREDEALREIEREVRRRAAAFCEAAEEAEQENSGEPRRGQVAALEVQDVPLSELYRPLWNDMELVKSGLEAAQASTDALLAESAANVSACGGALDTADVTELRGLEAGANESRAVHEACRSAEVDLKAAMDGEYQSFHGYWTSLALPPCGSAFPQAKWDDAWACLTALGAWTEAGVANVSARHDAWLATIAAHANKTGECHAHQQGFEAAVCSWVQGYTAACDRYAACYAAAAASHAQHDRAAREAEMAGRAEYASALHIQCQLRVLSATNATEKHRLLAECAAAQVNVSHLAPAYPAVPAERECGAASLPRPCDGLWVDASYVSRPWHAEAPAQQCRPCTGAPPPAPLPTATPTPSPTAAPTPAPTAAPTPPPTPAPTPAPPMLGLVFDHEPEFACGGCELNAEGAAAELPTSGPFTLMADVNPASGSSGFPGILGWGVAGDFVALRLWPGQSNGGLHMYWRANGGNTFAEAAVQYPGLLDGGWHRVAGSWDGQMMRLYVDGQLRHTVGYSGPFNAPNRGFCACVGEPGRLHERFQGSLRKVRVFNRALTDTEVQNVDSLMTA